MSKSELMQRIDDWTSGSGQLDFDNTSDPALTKTPDVPSGVSVTAVVDGILVQIDPTVDTAHNSVANFEGYIVYGRLTDQADTDVEIGRIPYGSFSMVWQQPVGGYVGYDVAVSAVTNTGYESARTAWYRCVLSTFSDDFSDYGGSALSPLEHLDWLKVAGFNSDETWSLTDAAVDTTNYVEGDQAIKVTADSSVLLHYSSRIVALDLSQEGRFTGDDYVCISVYVYDVTKLGHIFVGFFDGGIGNYNKEWTDAQLVTGWNHLKVKKSDLTSAGASWASIDSLRVGLMAKGVGDTADATFDDWRIVKASPSDATTYNNTGDVWIPSGGSWPVIPSNRDGEPSLPFTLGQIDTSVGWKFNYVQNLTVPNGRVSSLVYLKGVNGRAGVLFRVEDDTAAAEDSLGVILDTAANVAYLVQWEAGGGVATTNMVLNPSAEAASNFAAEGSATVTADTTHAYRGTSAYKVITTAAANDGMNLTLSALSNADHTVSFWVWDDPAAYTYNPFAAANVSLDGSTWHVPTVLATQEDWVRYGFTVDDAEANGSTTLYIEQTDATARTLYIDGVQVEAAAAATTYADGAQGLGYSWSGTAHASTSTRQAGSPVTHASASYTANPDVDYWVGVDFRDPDHTNRINVYIATDEYSLFTSATLVISNANTAPWPDGGGVGVVTYGANSRFGNFRAGSPQTADYAHRAAYADVAGVANVATILTSPIAIVTGDTTLTPAQFSILIDATSNTVTVTLPAAAGCTGKIYALRCINSTFTASVAAADHIEGEDSVEMVATGSGIAVLWVQSTGTTWYAINLVGI